jgi:hypothetical protein
MPAPRLENGDLSISGKKQRSRWVVLLMTQWAWKDTLPALYYVTGVESTGLSSASTIAEGVVEGVATIHSKTNRRWPIAQVRDK